MSLSEVNKEIQGSVNEVRKLLIDLQEIEKRITRQVADLRIDLAKDMKNILNKHEMEMKNYIETAAAKIIKEGEDCKCQEEFKKLLDAFNGRAVKTAPDQYKQRESIPEPSSLPRRRENVSFPEEDLEEEPRTRYIGQKQPMRETVQPFVFGYTRYPQR